MEFKHLTSHDFKLGLRFNLDALRIAFARPAPVLRAAAAVYAPPPVYQPPPVYSSRCAAKARGVRARTRTVNARRNMVKILG